MEVGEQNAGGDAIDRGARLLVLSRALAACCLATIAILPTAADAKRIARRDPIEPLVTTPAFLDQSAEFGVQWSRDHGDDEVDLAVGLEWIFWNRLELAAEIPVGIEIPEHGSTVGDLSDIELAAQILLCCEERRPLDYLSLRAFVAPPTGDRAKGIGGDGSWGASLLPGLYVSIADSLPDVLAQLEIGYAQQIRLDDEALQTARELGVAKTRQKEFIWNIAFAQPWFGGILQPVFEILGTTVVDAVASRDEGTIVELAAGFWFAPHPHEHWLSPLSYVLGAAVPLTSRRDDESVLIFVVEWALDTN